MPIKESEVHTKMFSILGSDLVPVKYSDELTTTRPADLAFCSTTGDWLPYLFVVYSFDTKTWYFSNARRHEELRDALEEDLQLDRKNSVCGQLNFDSQRLKSGGLIFDRLVLHANPPKLKEALEKLLEQVDIGHFGDEFESISRETSEPSMLLAKSARRFLPISTSNR